MSLLLTQAVLFCTVGQLPPLVTLKWLADLPGGPTATSPRCISPDGKFVGGTSEGVIVWSGNKPVIWKLDGSILRTVPMPPDSSTTDGVVFRIGDGGTSAVGLYQGGAFLNNPTSGSIKITNGAEPEVPMPVGISGDGTTAIFDLDTSNRSMRWSQLTGNELFEIGTRLIDMSSSETRLLGKFPARGFCVWDGGTSFVPLNRPAPGGNVLPLNLSSNGEISAGTLQDNPTYLDHPVSWNVLGVPTVFPLLSIDQHQGEIQSISNDGTVAIGGVNIAGRMTPTIWLNNGKRSLLFTRFVIQLRLSRFLNGLELIGPFFTNPQGNTIVGTAAVFDTFSQTYKPRGFVIECDRPFNRL